VTGVPAAGQRRAYLDWLRGVGVLIMIEGHALDSWTRVADRGREGYQWAIVTAGFGAPLFLFLAGVSLALAASSRAGKGLSRSAIARTALERGAWIFLLAFLFRLQSWLISGGAFPRSLLKVDILNVMGVSLIAAALLWFAGRSPLSRALLFVGGAFAVAMATPLVREASWLAALPDPLEWYLRPAPGMTTFTLFPWMAFLLAGAAAGTWLARTRSEGPERRAIAGLTGLGMVVAAAGYAASFLPPIYPQTDFWTSSPTFFFLRLGVVIAATGVAYLATRVWEGGPLLEFGRASLFVYWIHVEMAYGVLSLPIHRRLSFEGALAALAVFCVLLFLLVRMKDRFWGRGRSPEARSSGEAALRPVRSPIP
jgi:uncharacterized membrane protein